MFRVGFFGWFLVCLLSKRWEYLMFWIRILDSREEKSLLCFWKTSWFAQWPVHICTFILRLQMFSCIVAGHSRAGKVLLVLLGWRLFQSDHGTFATCRIAPSHPLPLPSLWSPPTSSQQSCFPIAWQSSILSSLSFAQTAAIAHPWLPCLFPKLFSSLAAFLGALYWGVHYISIHSLSLNFFKFGF